MNLYFIIGAYVGLHLWGAFKYLYDCYAYGDWIEISDVAAALMLGPVGFFPSVYHYSLMDRTSESFIRDILDSYDSHQEREK